MKKREKKKPKWDKSNQRKQFKVKLDLPVKKVGSNSTPVVPDKLLNYLLVSRKKPAP